MNLSYASGFEGVPTLGKITKWWFKRNEFARDWNGDSLINVGGWGVNFMTGAWHLGGEEGILPALPTSRPIEKWPRRMRLAFDHIARNGLNN